jgi:hypothetical protein
LLLLLLLMGFYGLGGYHTARSFCEELKYY